MEKNKLLNSKELIEVKDMLSNIKETRNNSKYRVPLYSIVVTIILSKDLFKRNTDISEFLATMDITFKEYVFKSRTTIVSRLVREIENADMVKLKTIEQSCTLLLFPNIQKKSSNKKNENNIDQLFDQFKRE